MKLTIIFIPQERQRAEEERLQRVKQAEMYRLGDSELEVIKRFGSTVKPCYNQLELTNTRL